jgi:hypothetical protein
MVVGINPFYTAVINLKPATLKINERILISHLGEGLTGNFDEQTLTGWHWVTPMP